MADDDLLERLRRGLSDRYEVVRQLGSGGMAVVYLARDRRHDRSVAIKVLKPELAAAVGVARFLREIAVVSSFEHPHIVALYDSGALDELPYYVMPFIEGASLDVVLRRERQLPIDDAVEITRQVGLALDYAHARGVLHRDIKPQNILMSDGHARVADFGIAQALTTAGTEKLTATGIVVGTLHYMSPEQANGAGEADHRSDIYSLGCVVYELLVGEPPFHGPTPQALIARHNLEPVPDLRIVRDTISPETERVVKKALAKVPADRFRSASEFAAALKRSLTTAGVPPIAPARPRWLVRSAMGGAALALIAMTAVMVRQLTKGVERSPRNEHMVAVLPFRFSGAADSAVLTPSGLVTLLSARLTGGDVIDAVDPALVLRQWTRAAASGEVSQADALAIGRELGAGMALIGTVQETRGRLAISGSLVATGSGDILYRLPEMSAPADSVAALLDRLGIALLLQRAGEGWRRPEELTTGRLDAVRSYVAGLIAYRRGRYTAAAGHFGRAVALDPGFALARMKLGMTHSAAGDIESMWQAFDEAWNERHRFSREDSLMLAALVRERIPVPSSYSAQLKPLEWAADSLPNQWEAAYALGDLLLHWGPMLGTEIPHQRARVAFEQTLRVDSAFAPALEHLVDLAMLAGDSATANRLGRRYLAVNSGADHADYIRWRLAVAARDSAARAAIRGRFATVDRNVLEQIMGISQLDGVAIDDGVAAAAELRSRARNDYDLWWMSFFTTQLALNRGRPADVPEEKGRGLFRLPLDALFRIVEALYWSGDQSTAEKLVQAHLTDADAPAAPGSPLTSPQFMWACVVSLWRLEHHQVRETHPALNKLRALRGAEGRTYSMYIPVCVAALEAQDASLTRAANARTAVIALDSVLHSGPVTNPHIRLAARITLSNLLERSGDVAGALRVVRERPYHHLSFGVTGLSELLFREGRLAQQTGDVTGAIRAYEHYLVLRESAAARFRPEYDHVRAELDMLKRTAGR